MDQKKPETPGFTLERFQDVVTQQTPPLLEAIVRNLKPILLGAGLVVLLAAGYALFSTYRNSALHEAQEELGTLLTQKSGAEKVAALESFLPKAPSALKPAVLFELAGTAMILNQYEKSLGFWRQLAGTVSGGEAILAHMGQARALALSGKPAEAVKELQDLKLKAAEPFKPAITRQIALAAEAAGDAETAKAAYGELVAGGQMGDKIFLEYRLDRLTGGAK